MKIISFISLFLILLSASIHGDVMATLDFTHDIEISDMPQISLGINHNIPAQTYLVKLEANQKSDDLEITVLEKEQLNPYRHDNVYHDIPTSDEANLYEHIISAIASDTLASGAISLIDEITINDIRYAKILVTPVTFESDDFCYLNHVIQIKLSGRILTHDDLFLYEEIISAQNQKLQNDTKATDDAAIKYLIVTSAEMAGTFQRQADYKSSIGIKTDVKIIDDITATQTGRDDAEKLREYLKQFYADGGEYLLLAGDETIVPIRYAYHNIAFSAVSLEDLQICDLYFADLSGNWDADNDNVFGEKHADSADIIPELKVGRLPFNRVSEAENYIDKLISYETDPGGGDMAYLEKSIFISTDQMRDYPDGGQHYLISRAYPGNFEIDTVNGVEQSNGEDLNPTNLSAVELEPVLEQGYGIINIITHGSSSTFGVKSSGYNNFPKSSFTTDTLHSYYGIVNDLEKNYKPSFYYSLACDNGAFDKDGEPFNQPNPNLVQTLLGLEDAGAVGFVANSRWGWVSSSHQLQELFFDSLFANPELPAVDAMNQMKQVFYYYRDQVYGINYYGDPTMKVYTSIPGSINLATSYGNNNLTVCVTNEHEAISNCRIILSNHGEVILEGVSGADGKVELAYNFDSNENYVISAVSVGYKISRTEFVPSIATDVDGDENNGGLPESFTLYQNYPNPFNPSTVIAFELPHASSVDLSVFNVLGQKVKTLLDKKMAAGSYSVDWDGRDYKGSDVASGVYFYRIETGKYSDIKKMVLIM